MQLAQFTAGKNNNFNLIRIIAALAVLVGHSFALQRQPEPLGASLGMSLGSIAVDLFFIASGFLVSGSLLLRQHLGEYSLARILRIYPALLLMLLLTVFGLGVFFTTLPALSYLGQTQTYAYLLKCLSLVGGVEYYLPGVFADHPYPGAVNGSLWTMVYEIKMYIFLGLLWLACGWARQARVRLFRRLILLAAVSSGIWVLLRHFYLGQDSQAARLFFMFFSGAAYWVLQQHLRLSGKLALLLGLGLALAAYAGQAAFFIVYQLTLAYLLFYLAYVPAGWIRQYNAAGDYSYGVYIYAFPIQQSVLALLPGVSVWRLMLISALATLACAMLSWYGIEQPALKLKGVFAGKLRRPAVPLPASGRR